MNRMDKSEGKKSKKTRRGKKKIVEFNDSDFSFLRITNAIDCSSLEITDKQLQCSASFKILRDEFLSPQCSENQSNEEDIADLQCLKQKLLKGNSIIYIANHKSDFKPLCVEKSLLNKKEHSQCIKALEIITSGVEPNTKQQDDIDLFMKLETKRFHEYSKFSKYVENEWMVKNKPRLLEIQQDLKNFISFYWKSKQTRVLDYPNNYRVMSMLPLENKIAGQQSHVEVSPEEIIYQCGTSELLNIQDLRAPHKCINDYDILASKTSKIKEQKLKNSVSQDEVCIDLSRKYYPNIVISSSGLKCLIDNHPPNYHREWIMPVVIKEFNIDNDYKRHKVVFVEKPLPSLRYSIHQQNQWANKISLKVSSTLNKENKNCQQDSTSEKLEDDELNFSKTSETLHKSPHKSPVENTSDIKMLDEQYEETELQIKEKHFVENNLKIKENECDKMDTLSEQDDSENLSTNYNSFICDKDDDSDSDNLLIDDTIDENNISCEIDQSNKRITRSMSKTTSNNNSPSKNLIKSPPKPNDLTQNKNSLNIQSENENENSYIDVDKNKAVDIEISKKIKNENVMLDNEDKKIPLTTYRIWKFLEKSDNDSKLLQKDTDKELKVLIRTKTHGKAIIKNIEKEVMLMPKLEYQMEYGAECSSISENTRQWCSLFFQPDTTLVRVRINPEDSKICMKEILDINGIANEINRIHKHNPKKDLNRLFRILNIMHSSLMPGVYILKHDVKMAEGVKLYMADSSCNPIQLNLHKLYENITLDKVSLEQSMWNPIDPFIVTPKHKKECILPSMFSWKIDKQESKYQQDSKTKNKLLSTEEQSTKRRNLKRKRNRNRNK